MTKQMTYLGGDKILGWLVWWTIRQGEYNLQSVSKEAFDKQIPLYIQDKLSGRNIESAFLGATQLGATGKSIGSANKMKRRLVTRNPIEEDNRTRALVIEETNPTWETEEWVTAKTAAILRLSWNILEVEWAEWVDDDPCSHEIKSTVDEMNRTMHKIEGKINDTRIRSALLNWLKNSHSVTVRGAGGVYYLPNHSRVSKQRMKNELLSIMEWLKTINSPFSVVAINESGVHSLDSFREDAIGEIRTELVDIQEKIKRWEANPNMNAGSMHYSAGTQIDRLDELTGKVTALKEALGEEIGVADEMATLIKGKLQEIIKIAERQMDTDKTALSKRRREAAAKKRQEEKAGTVRNRKKKKAF